MRLCLLMLLASCATTPRADESVWLVEPVEGTVKLLLTVNELGFVTAPKVFPDGGPVASTREYAFTFSLDPF